MSEHKSDSIELHVNGELLAEFRVEKMAIEVTRREVLIRAQCTDTYADKVLFSAEGLERLGYAPDASDIPPVSRPWWRHLLAAVGAS